MKLHMILVHVTLNVFVGRVRFGMQTLAPKKGLPYHEWFVEFESKPKSMKDFSSDLCEALQARNTYYSDLVKGKVIQNAVVKSVKKNSFNKAMSSMGKLGGQNKVPRLSNDRTFADQL